MEGKSRPGEGGWGSGGAERAAPAGSLSAAALGSVVCPHGLPYHRCPDFSQTSPLQPLLQPRPRGCSRAWRRHAPQLTLNAQPRPTLARCPDGRKFDLTLEFSLSPTRTQEVRRFCRAQLFPSQRCSRPSASFLCRPSGRVGVFTCSRLSGPLASSSKPALSQICQTFLTTTLSD